MSESNSSEVWAPVPGLEGWYSVSNQGRVRRKKTVGHAHKGDIVNPWRINGYVYIMLYANGRRTQWIVHRLVLFAFVGPPKLGQETRHLNGTRDDNRLENLCWGTHAENVADSIRHGTAYCVTQPTKLTASQVKEIRCRYAKGNCTQSVLAAEFKVSQMLISLIIRFKRYREGV